MPLASEMVCAVDELTMAGAVSRYAVMVGFVRTGVVSVLFVSVSVVARPTRVSVEVGSVSVPVFEMVAMIGVVNVLFVSVSVVARPTKVSVDVGKVSVPVFEIVAIIGAVNVLFVSVSVVARPTKVSVEVGKVNTPVFEIVAMIGAVNVLFVSVSVVALPTRVSGRRWQRQRRRAGHRRRYDRRGARRATRYCYGCAANRSTCGQIAYRNIDGSAGLNNRQYLCAR